MLSVPYKVDFVPLLDGTTKSNPKDFKRMKVLVTKLAKTVKLGPKHSRITVLLAVGARKPVIIRSFDPKKPNAPVDPKKFIKKIKKLKFPKATPSSKKPTVETLVEYLEDLIKDPKWKRPHVTVYPIMIGTYPVKDSKKLKPILQV